MAQVSLLTLFHVDGLSWILLSLVSFIALVVGSFAYRYMRGDDRYGRFFALLTALTLSVATMVTADHLLLLFVAWGLSNTLLVLLMVHKPGWRASQASGNLAAKTFGFGFAAIAAAFALLYAVTGTASIQAILAAPPGGLVLTAVLVLLLIGAMTQSAVWPFHRWLTSSLNSPTPISAFMHAGLVNAGGFLLARFAALYFEQVSVLTIVFVAGLITAFLGTLWKLMQHDVKRMLGCSTMAQMGFMFVQCGLGLFPAAVAHLCWHGLFKANLFLASGAAAQEKRLDLAYPPSLLSFATALLCGAVGAGSFALASGKPFLPGDTTLFLITLVFIAASQFSLPMLRDKPFGGLPVAVLATAGMGLLYGLIIYLIELALAPMGLARALPLNGFHLAGLGVLVAAWLAILFVRHPDRAAGLPDWVLRAYVRMLNASQPHPSTVTAHRNHYQIV